MVKGIIDYGRCITGLRLIHFIDVNKIVLQYICVAFSDVDLAAL